MFFFHSFKLKMYLANILVCELNVLKLIKYALSLNE